MRRLLFIALLLMSFQTAASATETRGGEAFIGQWVWSARDANIFNDTLKSVPGLVPCIWVSTVSASDGRIVQRLANPPGLARRHGPVAVVIRFDDSFSSVWKAKTAKEVAGELDERLSKLTGIIAGTGTDVSEVQLDYDCPVRLLQDWSKVVRALKEGSLKGMDVWITSLPCHIDVQSYGAWFRGSVKGHIIQVFDTGVTCDSATVDRIVSRLRKQKIAFRVGLGAFERTNGMKSTDHRQWFTMLPEFSGIPEYRGVWVFPGGKRWDYLL